jgi:hypothetical protein
MKVFLRHVIVVGQPTFEVGERVERGDTGIGMGLVVTENRRLSSNFWAYYYMFGRRRVRIITVSFGDPFSGSRSVLVESDTTDPAVAGYPNARLQDDGLASILFMPRLSGLL